MPRRLPSPAPRASAPARPPLLPGAAPDAAAAEAAGRRAPSQARGAARVDAVLDAAERVIAEAGVDGASMNAIARAARTAPGSLYHFFRDKDALLDALAERQAAAFARLHAAAVPPEATAWPLRRALAHALTRFAAFYQAHPTFEPVRRAVARRAARADAQHARDAADLDVVRAALEPLLAAHLRGRPAAARRRVAHAVVAMADGVLSATAESPAAERRALVGELLEALDAYLTRLGATQPPAAPRPRKTTPSA